MTATRAILAELGRTGAPRTARELAALCELKRTVVDRALGEMAVEGRATRTLLTDRGYLLVRWVVRR